MELLARSKQLELEFNLPSLSAELGIPSNETHEMSPTDENFVNQPSENLAADQSVENLDVNQPVETRLVIQPAGNRLQQDEFEDDLYGFEVSNDEMFYNMTIKGNQNVFNGQSFNDEHVTFIRQRVSNILKNHIIKQRVRIGQNYATVKAICSMRRSGSPTCKTIWNFYFWFDGHGQLYRSNSCTQYCMEFYNLIYKIPISICPWCSQNLHSNLKLRFHIAALQKNLGNEHNSLNEIKKEYVTSGIKALKEKEKKKKKEKSTTATTAASQTNRMLTRSQTKLLPKQ